MKRLTVPLLIIGMMFGYVSVANAAAQAVLAGGAAIAASIPTVYTQLEDWGNWWSSDNLTPDQVKQVNEAIAYLDKKGFKKEAKQARGMLSSNLFVYQKPPKAGEEDDTAAVTYGGIKNSIFDDGHITLRGFFGATHDGPIQFAARDGPTKKLADEQRIRFQAKTIIHELEHLNTQANAFFHPAILDWITDREEGPTKKHLGSLRDLGYNNNEIGKIKEEYEINLKPQKFIDIIEKERAKPEPPPEPPQDSTGSEPASATEPNAVSGSTTEPGPDATSDRPRKQRSDATKSKGPRTVDDEPTKTKGPPREKSDSGDQSDTPVDPYVKGPTPDQIARAGKLGDQAQGGVPGTSQQTGARTGQTGQPQGGYQGGQEVPGAPGPQQPGQQPGLVPPYDPRIDPRGGMNVPTPGGQPQRGLGGGTKSGEPPPKVAQTPTAPGQQKPPAQGAQCSAPLCRQMSQANCERLGGPNCANMAASLPSCPGFPTGSVGPLTKAQQALLAPEKVRAACYSNMLLRCQQGEAGGTGGFCVRKGGEPSCEVRAQRSC